MDLVDVVTLFILMTSSSIVAIIIFASDITAGRGNIRSYSYRGPIVSSYATATVVIFTKHGKTAFATRIKYWTLYKG